MAYKEVIQAEERRTFATFEKINCYLIEGKVVTDFGTLSTLVYLVSSKVEEPSFDRKTSPYGVHLRLSEEGDTLRSRYYRQKIAYGFHVGYIRNLYRLTPSVDT